MKKIFIILVLLFIHSSCENSIEEPAFESEIESFEEEISGDSEIALEKPSATVDRKVIWNADLVFQVKDVDEFTKKISKICEKYDAFISHMNLSSTNYEVSNQITIRVKNENFNTLINEIKGGSVYIKKLEISSNDVTEEYIDIQSRLETKRQVRERYIDLLRNKTGEIKDVIAAEDAIRIITEEIEAKEGRLRFLNDKISFSTIDVQIYQKVDFKEEPEVFEKTFVVKAKEAFENGWEILVGIILFFFTIWPIILLLILIIWKRKWFKRKSK